MTVDMPKTELFAESEITGHICGVIRRFTSGRQFAINFRNPNKPDHRRQIACLSFLTVKYSCAPR